jgi:anti-sigma factor RsiW
MIAKLTELFGAGHVPAGRMIAYLDRELPAWRARRVAGHLTRCESCRGELQDVRARLAVWDYETEHHTPPAAALLAGRERLLRAMKDWASLRKPAGGCVPVAKAADELSVFARSSGDYLRLHGDGASARRALTSIDPVLAAFLGKATASSLRALVNGILPPDLDSMVSNAI